MINGSVAYFLNLDRLNLSQKELINQFGIVNNFLCPEAINATLEGGLSSSFSSSISVNVLKCENKTMNSSLISGIQITGNNRENITCAPQEDIDRVFNNLELFVGTIYQFFDDQEQEKHPIKNSLNMQYFTTAPQISQNYYNKISFNLVKTKDSSFINMDPQIYTYVGIRADSTFAKTPNEMFAHINVMYFADEKYMITEREVLTISAALSATGGYIETIRLICVAFIYIFRAESFYISLMKKFLITETYQNGPAKVVIQSLDNTFKDDIARNYNKIHKSKLSQDN
ncbi:UNKNOWN [Stylonychia lemnae]|uniref:Uncharacterized protein n=1 Tax=Stylonychia lemnae TaxID=5949 RepID=A0A077ZUY8_STYLE|nr:UNKNOWN [Stylonychia lemnae]|eukprot:CDW73704.1 UNKNOWN [Stylonychia lemnae]